MLITVSSLHPQFTLTPHYNPESQIHQNGSLNPEFCPGNHPDPNAVQMPIVVPNIITDDLIDPVLLGDGGVAQQMPNAQTTVNPRDPSLYPKPDLGDGADADRPLLSIFSTPNPEPGSQYGAIADWDLLSTCPQTRIPDDLLVVIIANTAT